MRSTSALSAAALASLGLGNQTARAESIGLPGLPHFAPKAKRIIYLFQSGAPSQMDLFDPKPTMEAEQGKPARIDSARPTLDDNDFWAEEISDRFFDFQVRAARRIAYVVQRIDAAHVKAG